MAWLSSSFQWPQVLESIHSQTESVYDLAKTQCDSQINSLIDLDLLAIQPSDLAEPSTIAEALKSQINDLIANNGLIAVAHPWQHTIGQGEGHHRALSAPNAVLSLCQALKHSPDRMSGVVEAVSLLLTANNLPSLSDKLRSFNAVFEIPELQFAERKARQVLSIEQSKRIINEQSVATQVKPREPKHLATINVLQDSLKRLNANIQAMDLENVHPVTELAQVLQRKKEALQSRQDDYVTLSEQLTGGEFYARLNSGNSLYDLAVNIERSDYPGHEWTHSVAVMLIGPAGKLSLFRAVFGL